MESRRPACALVQLAGLSRKEEPEAHDLFTLACDELGLTPTLPPDPGAACWELIRWLSELIVAGDMPTQGQHRKPDIRPTIKQSRYRLYSRQNATFISCRACRPPAAACQVHHVRHKANTDPTSPERVRLAVFL